MLFKLNLYRYTAVYPLRPYMLFDASGGSQQKSATGSLSNAVEALMVVCLFKQLEAVLRQRGESVKDRCSVITPYREQRSMIIRAFAALCGGEGAAMRYGVGLYKLNPVDPQIESDWFQPVSLCSETLISRFAFKFNLYRYTAVQVSTIDGFQGQEADVIIVSTVRGGASRGGVGFLADVRRMNVALVGLYKSTHCLKAPGFDP